MGSMGFLGITAPGMLYMLYIYTLLDNLNTVGLLIEPQTQSRQIHFFTPLCHSFPHSTCNYIPTCICYMYIGISFALPRKLPGSSVSNVDYCLAALAKGQ